MDSSNHKASGILLSICIMTYNRALLLQETLRSILINGLPEDVEIVISDNCSTDETEAAVKPFLENKAVRYFKNEFNSGFDGNVIHSIKRARGKYTWMFSDDDLMPEGVLQYVLSYLRKETVWNLVYVAHYSFRDGEPYANVYRTFYPKKDLVFSNGFQMFQTAGFGFISSLMFNTALAQQLVNSARAIYNNVHIEVALKIALSIPGNYLFIGEKSVAARMPLKWSRMNMLRDGYYNTMRIYDEFVQAGLLEGQYVQQEKGRIVFNSLPRFIISAAISSELPSIKPLQPLLKSVFPSTLHKLAIDLYYFISDNKPAVWLLGKIQQSSVSRRKKN